VIVRLDPAGDPFLREHRLRDKPTLPMVVALETFAETAALLTGSAQTMLAVRDVRIADAVRFFNEQPAEVRVLAVMSDEGISCRLTSDFRNRRGELVQKDRLHFSASVMMGERSTKLDEAAPAVSGEWFDVTYPPREALMYHGLPLRLLKRGAIGDTCAWGQLELPAVNELAGSRDANGWLTPSAAVDACLYACGVYTWLCGDHGVTVPDSLGELRFGRTARPSERAIVHLVCRELQEKFGVFDFTLFGDDGAVIFQATKYRCHVLRAGGAPADRATRLSQSKNPSLPGRPTS
jgi:3-hydroxymyristoyl/3-hydroxydecanoyl-(acyl carrier protein) dehydratase